jgi:hypothetical protein
MTSRVDEHIKGKRTDKKTSRFMKVRRTINNVFKSREVHKHTRVRTQAYTTLARQSLFHESKTWSTENKYKHRVIDAATK